MTTSRSTDAEALSIAHDWPIREPNVVGLLPASNRNENFLLEDSAQQRFVLRRYRRNQDEGRVNFQLRFQKHLLANGFPTASILETQNGRLYSLLSGVPWALFSWVEGTEYDFGRADEVSEAGRRLAQFHTVGQSFREPEVTTPWEKPLRSWWLDQTREATAIAEMFDGRGVDSEIAYVDTCRRWVVETWPLTRLDALPQGWVHADYHGRNMLFDDESNMVGLFDFDVLFRGWLAYDLARGVHAFGRERRGSNTIRPQVAGIFLDSYEKVRHIVEEEVRAIPAFLLLLSEAMSADYLSYRQRDGDDPLSRFLEGVAGLREVVEEMRRLAAEFGWEAPE